MHLFFYAKLSVKKITIYAKLSDEKNQIGKVFVYHCSDKISASKMNEKKISFNGLKMTILALYLHIENQFTYCFTKNQSQ